MLGFRIDSAELLDKLLKEVVSLQRTALKAPSYGVVCHVETGEEEGGLGLGEGVDGSSAASAAAAGGKKAALSAAEEDGVAAAAGGAGRADASADALAAYYADSNKSFDRPVLFSRELGLAVETPPEGLTLAQLWSAL